MKKWGVVLALLLALTCIASAQETGIIADLLERSAKEKVARMQQLIGFDNDKANQLCKLETTFLLEVWKVETCSLCNRKKRVGKLKTKREADLQKILSRDEYIKYQSLENELLNENVPVWLSINSRTGEVPDCR